MLMSGCTNLIGGTTPEYEINYGILEEGSGMLDENGNLKESTRTGVNVRLNYLAGGDYGANKYSASYKDAFFIAEDLSNDMLDVGYFNLLDTYENSNGNTTFVYVYQTKQYADGAKRGDLVRVQEEGDYVLYPDVMTQEEIPTSNTFITVLATYAFEEGASSYHEISRVPGDLTSSMLAKPIYSSETNDANNATVEYYSILSQDKIYVYNADNVKAYSNGVTAKTEISSSYGNIVSGGGVDTSFGSVLSTGFEKKFDIQSEFNAFKSNDATLKNGNYDVDVYDYSIYTHNEDFYVTLDISATKQGYTGPDIEVEVVDEDGNPIADTETADDTVEDEVEDGAAFDFVGTICHVKIPEGTLFDVEYIPTKTLKQYGLNFATEYNYRLTPHDNFYYPELASGTVYGTSDRFTNLFGFYSYVVEPNYAGCALDIGRDGFFSFTEEAKNNYNLEKDFDEAQFYLEYKKRDPKYSEYKYKNASYKLVTNPDAYWAFLRNNRASSYTINLTGDFDIKWGFNTTKENWLKIFYPSEMLVGKINGEYINASTAYIRDLGFKLYNGYLDASAFVTAEAGVVSPTFICDDLAVFKGTMEVGISPEGVVYGDYITPYVIPLTSITNIMTDYSWLLNNIIKISIDTDAGKFQKIDTAIRNGQLYVYYIFDKKVIICRPDTGGLDDLAELEDNANPFDKIAAVVKNCSVESGVKYHEVWNYPMSDIEKYYEFSTPSLEYYVVSTDSFVTGGDVFEEAPELIEMDDEAQSIIDNAGGNGSAGGTAQVYTEYSADSVTRKYISIVFEYEGVSFYDSAGNALAENVSYDDLVAVINGEKTIGSVVNNSTEIINNWDTTQTTSEMDTYTSIKAAVSDGLHFRYSTVITENDDDTITVDIKQITGTGDVTLYTYNLTYTDSAFAALDHLKEGSEIDGTTWSSICKYVKDRMKKRKTGTSTADLKLDENAEPYSAYNLDFISGTFDNDGTYDNYIVSTSAGNGLGFYDLGNGTYFIPSFQRHEVRNVTSTTQVISGNNVTEYSKKDTTDNIVTLDSVACYGIYENKSDNSDIYPYYFMGYDRDGMTYTGSEMLKAQMVPFGVAYKNADGTYYRDFVPEDGDTMVYYLPTAYYNQYGMRIVDETFDGFDGDDDNSDDEDTDSTPGGDGGDPTPSGQGGDGNPTPSGGPDTNPSGSGGGINPTPSGSGGGDNPYPSGGPDTNPSGGGNGGNPTPSGGGEGNNPYPSGGGGENDPYPSGGGGGNPTPTGDRGGGGNGGTGFTGEVYSNQPRITSIYGNGNGDGTGDGSASDNSISGNSTSGNSVSGNGGRPVDGNPFGDTGDGSGTGRGLSPEQIICLLLIILLIILIVAWIIERKRQGKPILPIPVKRKKEEEQEEGVSTSENNDDLFTPVEVDETINNTVEELPSEPWEEPEREYNISDDDFLAEEEDIDGDHY